MHFEHFKNFSLILNGNITNYLTVELNRMRSRTSRTLDENIKIKIQIFFLALLISTNGSIAI